MQRKILSKKCKSNCSVPQCTIKEYSSLHKLPRENKLRKKWIIMCRIGKVTSNTLVCGAHFNDNDFIPAVNPKTKKLKINAFPSLNLPVRPLDKVLTPLQVTANVKRAERAKMREIKKQNVKNVDTSEVKNQEEKSAEIQESICNNDVSGIEESFCENNAAELKESVYEDDENIAPLDLECEDSYHQDKNTDETQEIIEAEDDKSAEITAAEILLQLKNKCADFSKNKNVSVSDKNIETEKLTLMNLLVTDDDLKVFTGINFVLLENLKEALLMCEKKPNQYGLCVKGRIVFCLCKLKLNLTFKCLAILFNIRRQTCSNLFYITLHSLAFILKSAIYWPSKEEITHSMPKCFSRFSNTYIVLDCTEIPVERANCLRCRLRTYSHYKGCETIKVLVGISPSGLIIFISKPYGGRASDKSIFNQSGIIHKLVPTRDAIMVDKGFLIEEECANNYIQLYIPPKLGNNKQLSTTAVTSTVEIAAARVHVERTIQRMKLFNILKSKISQKIAPYMEEVFQIICGIVNLSESIMSDKRFSK